MLENRTTFRVPFLLHSVAGRTLICINNPRELIIKLMHIIFMNSKRVFAINYKAQALGVTSKPVFQDYLNYHHLKTDGSAFLTSI